VEIVSHIEIINVMGALLIVALSGLFALLAWMGKAFYAELRNIKDLFLANSAHAVERMGVSEMRLTRLETKVDAIEEHNRTWIIDRIHDRRNSPFTPPTINTTEN